MPLPAPVNLRVSVIAGSSLVGTVVTVLGLLLLWAVRADGVWVAMFLVPMLILATAPALARQAARERDRMLFWMLLAALLLKLAGAIVRYVIAIKVYGGFVDAVDYHLYGAEIAANFRAGHFDTGLESLTSTDFIRFFTGLMYTVIGPSPYAGFLLYSWLAFWGMFYAYRAFTIAVPGGNRHSYARLLFFLPSMLYWPSSIGKDAWMLFALGLAAFGLARILTGWTWRGLVITAVGLWMAAVVRPHVAGMAAIGIAVAYMVGRPQRRGGYSWVIKLAALPAMVVLAVVLLGQTAAFLEKQGLDPEDGVTSVFEQNASRTSKGGSSYEGAPPGTSPALLPWAAVTILFRPFLFEAHNAQAAVTALESTVLLGLAIARWRPILRTVRRFRRLPYVTFVVVYGLLFVVAFSSIGNFGIIARERVQLLPFFFVLLAAPGVGARRLRPPAPSTPTQRSPHAGQLVRA